MKKFVNIVIFYLIFSIQPAFASQAANLHIKVAGTSKENTYFLCINHGGCMSMYAATHGKNFPIEPGKIKQIFMVNAKNLQVSFQQVPSSCHIEVTEKQTLTVSGKIVQNENGAAQISNLNCSVS